MDTLLLPLFAPLSFPSDPLHDLYEPFCPSNINPLPSFDQFSCHSAPLCKKRKSLPDISCPEQLIDTVCRSAWSSSPMTDSSSPAVEESHSQWLHNSAAEAAPYIPDEEEEGAAMSATRNCVNELEDVLNFLWMEDDAASTAQSAAAATPRAEPGGSAEEQQLPLLITDFDWQAPGSFGYAEASPNGNGGCHGELDSEIVEVGSSPKQEEKCSLPSEAGGSGRSKQQQGMLHMADWVEQLAGWQGGVKSTWEGERRSWQRKEGGARASWQAPGKRMAMGEEADGCAQAWAGPTLLDIESALALTEQSHGEAATPCSARKANLSLFVDVKALLAQDEAPQLDSHGIAWRQKLQKRSSQEPKYTVKVESEEKALGDGYRWRKYGQKTIKNSPFPRSYYRCSTGKCNAKKQVERCPEGLFLVTYEGIHLHHKPIMLHKLRLPGGDGMEDDREKGLSSETEKSPASPSSSTSCSPCILPHTA